VKVPLTNAMSFPKAHSYLKGVQASSVCPTSTNNKYIYDDEYGAVLEWYWQRKTSVIVRTVFQCYTVRHKSHLNWSGIEPWLPQREASD